jgi:hypothetical protein
VNFGRLLALWHARNLEFLRDRSTLVFNLLFPLALVVAFAVIFGGQPRALFKVDVVAPPGVALDGDLHPFLATRYVDFVRVESGDLMATVRKVERHQVDLLIDLRGAPRYWVNEDSPKGYLAEKLLLESASGEATREPVSGVAVRYVDWLLPGILGMNMMFSCLFGVGYVVVRYRKSGFLRRLSATPVTAFEFGAAQVLSRLLLTVSVTALLYGARSLNRPTVEKQFYFNFASVSFMFCMACLKSSSEAAKDKRIQFGFPKASPVTSETRALFSIYIQKSSASRMVVSPSDFPK